jgi:hypothetical protein
VRFLRRLLGLDTLPLPQEHEGSVNGVSEAERHFDDAVQDARAAMGRVEFAHRVAVERQRQNAIAEALLRARDWGSP